MIVSQRFKLLLVGCSLLCTSTRGAGFVEDSERGARKLHWAYVAPARGPIPPAVIQFGSDGTAIDRFINANLIQQKLTPAGEADRRTLVRRLYFDLLGLPPAPEVVDEFVSDPTADAYGKLIDRVLASPHFGERFAMIWLDLVRYGDTNGFHADVHRNVFPYRDYVIKAFNENKPFDQFTVEQLAGDLLPSATLEQKVASGYNRMNMITTEGGAQAKEYLAKYAADRVRNASAVWLASTIGCAECHDHKFDPFTARDFYSFAAFFADVKQVGVYPNQVDLDPQLKVPTPAQSHELQQLDQRIAALQKVLDTPTAELEAAQFEWERTLPDNRIAWSVLTPMAATAQNGTMLVVQGDGSVLASGETPEVDTYTLSCSSDLKAITALRIEAIPDDSLPAKGPGRASNGNFVLSQLTLELAGPNTDRPRLIAFQNASASYEQKGGTLGVAGAIDATKKDAKTGWAIADQFGRPHHAIFETKEDIGGPGVTFKVNLHQTHGGQHTLGRFRLSATESARPATASATKIRGVPDSIVDIVQIEPTQRSTEQTSQLAAYFRSVAPQLEPIRTEITETKKRRDGLDRSIPNTLYTVAVEPPAMHILPRGNWLDESGEIVQPGVPHFLPQPDSKDATAAPGSCFGSQLDLGFAGTASQPLTRLDLARWTVSQNNPLTARVFVNRLWKTLFGQGLVRTSEDFGRQGTPPTHPELLDWLSLEFVDSGWDIKHVIRLIVMSDAYRRSSQPSPEMRRVDPYNYWLARQARFRLDAEIVRDNALATSDMLMYKLGGRSVKPYQPDGYWDHCNTFQGKLIYDQDHGEDLYRRGLYTYWKRTFLHPAFLAFDAPSREECTAERPRSNTPLQALVLLNDPTYVEAARVFAERIIRAGGQTAADRLTYAFRRALARSALPAEQQLLSAMLDQHLDQFRSDPSCATELIRVGEWPVPQDIDAVELAAWTSVARIILNLHETVTRL